MKIMRWISTASAARGVLALAAFLAFHPPAFGAGPEQISDSALQQIGALEQEKASRSAAQRKLDAQFVFRLKQDRHQAIAAGATALRPDIQFEADGRVLVDIDAEVTEALLAQIRQAGGTVLNSVPRFHSIRAQVPLEQLEALTGGPGVKFIHRAARAHTNIGSVTSEGDVTHRANTVRGVFGVNGQGVKVGVLSDSIDYLADSQASGDLGEVTILPGQAGSGSGEGTAMLEIVHDLAPGAQLYFATAFSGEAGFAQNILDLRSNGCDIIMDDVGYFDESPFQDALIARAVNAVTADGALYFSAAGNDGSFKDGTSCTWEGDFADSGQVLKGYGARIHSFGATNYDTVLVGGDGVDLFWADPLGASTNDYDLFVLDNTGNNVVAVSDDPQTGTQDPYESIASVNAGERIVIVKSAGADRFLHLDTSRGLLSFSTSGATRGHPAAAGAFDVAAVDALQAYPNPFSSGNSVETFSSDGPRRVFYDAGGSAITPGNFSSTGGAVRQKPDIAAADGVVTHTFGQFFGTSAAAPHAGAIAALLLSYDHTLTPAQVRAALTESAVDIEGPGTDVNSGAGIVMAQAALQTLPPRPVIVAGRAALLNESSPDGALDPGETVTVALTLTNIGAAGTGNLIATLLNTGGVTFASGPQNYGPLAAHGGTTNQLFTFIASGDGGGTDTATLQLRDGPTGLGAVSFIFRLGVPIIPLSENFDEVTPPALPPGWTAVASGAGNGWQTTANASDTPPNSIFVPDPSAASDKSLTSPALPISSPAAQLTFRHRYNVETGYDFGWLEISIGGGPFTEILQAGGSFVEGGYNDSGQGWTGVSDGFITTKVNLPSAAAGQNVQLRWRFASDYSVGYEGWYVDSVSVTDGYESHAPVADNVVVGISAAPEPVTPGGDLTYTINVGNTGPDTATGVSLSDVLPANFTLQSISFPEDVYPGPGLNGLGALDFSIGTLAGGATATIILSGTADQAGMLTNRATIARADGGIITRNSATAVTPVIPPSLSIQDVSLFDGDSGTTNALFNVTLSCPAAQTATVQYATMNLTAIAGADYFSTNGTLTFAPGATNQTIAVRVIGSPLNKPDNTFAVNLLDPTNVIVARSQGIGTILNDYPLPYLSVSDATVVKPDAGTTNAVFNVSLTPPSGQSVAVGFETADGTALGDLDYVPVSTDLIFAPGQTNLTVTVVVTNHASAKPSQFFYATLYSASNAKIDRNTGAGTIVTALPGQMDHFDWDPISSPQISGRPFTVILRARDFFDGPAGGFSGTAALSGFFAVTSRTNTFFGNASYEATGPAGDTYGYSFTPKINMTVAAFRHFSGGKILLWTDAGNLLASTNYADTEGTWSETPLAVPVQLLAGHTYRLGFYAAGNLAYGSFSLASDHADATLQQSYYAAGDAFPNLPDTVHYALVDIRYAVPIPVPLPVSPTNSGVFASGVWSGSLLIQPLATNASLTADDGFNHIGGSNPFDVIATPLPLPSLQAVGVHAGAVQLTWGAVSGLWYQIQFKTNLNQTDWLNLGGPTNATTGSLWLTDPIGADSQRFYRIQAMP